MFFLSQCCDFRDTQNESSTDIQLTKADFPAMKFARVKSYTSESEAPLIAQDSA